MPVKPEGFFYQLNDDRTINENSRIPFSQKFSDDQLSEQQLARYVSYEIWEHYRLFETFRIKKFTLRKPFYIVVTLQKKQYEFICQSIPASYISKLLPEDYPFRLKKTLFVVLPKRREIKQPKQQERTIPPSDLNRLLNAIDARVQRDFKTFSPILYTGMTN